MKHRIRDKQKYKIQPDQPDRIAIKAMWDTLSIENKDKVCEQVGLAFTTISNAICGNTTYNKVMSKGLFHVVKTLYLMQCDDIKKLLIAVDAQTLTDYARNK